MRCLLQGMLEAGYQALVEGNLHHLPGVLADIVDCIADKQAALAIVANVHAHLVRETSPSAAFWLTSALPHWMAGNSACPELQVADHRFMHMAVAKAQQLQVRTSA